MKRLFTVAAIAMTLAACNNTEKTDTTMTNVDTSKVVVVAPVEGDYMQKDGKAMVMQGTEWVPVTAETTLANGMKVNANGEIMDKEGKTVTLADGYRINANGIMVDKDGVVIDDRSMLQRTTDGIENGANKAGETIENGVNSAGEGIRKGANEAGDAINKGVNKAGEAVQTGATKTKEAVQTGAKKTGEAINKGVNKVTGN